MKMPPLSVVFVLLFTATFAFPQNLEKSFPALRVFGSEGTSLTVSGASFADKVTSKQGKEIVPGKDEVFLVLPFIRGGDAFKITEAVLSDANGKKIKAKTLTEEHIVFEVRKGSKWKMMDVSGKKGSRELAFHFWDMDKLAIK